MAVLYASAYGNTAALAQAISRGITKAGVGVETLNLEDSALDEVEAAVEQAGGFIIGSPTLGGHMPTQASTGWHLVSCTIVRCVLCLPVVVQNRPPRKVAQWQVCSSGTGLSRVTRFRGWAAGHSMAHM